MEKQIIIYCDGGSRGNPGPAASAFVATKNKKIIAKGSKFFKKETNNFAEYTAVLLAIKWLTKYQVLSTKYRVVINLDSQLVERQLNGFYKIKNENLKNIYLKIKNLEKLLDFKITFVWSTRDKNKLADELVNITLDKHLQRERQ